MFYVVCPQCRSQVQISPDAVGPDRTDLFNATACFDCGLSFSYDDEEVVAADQPPSQFI
jgi:hypothetical protein